MYENVFDFYSTFVSFRFLYGLADVAVSTLIISILITLFPHNVASVLSWFEVLTGLAFIVGMHA